MNIIKIALFSFVIFLFTNKLFAQGTCSGNGEFIFSISDETGQNVINIHKFKTKEYLKNLEFDIKNTSEIDSVFSNYNGNLVCANQDNNFFIWNVSLGKQITKIFSLTEIILAENDEFYIVLKNNTLKKYDATSATELLNYEIPVNQTISDISLSSDDKFICGKTSTSKVYIWDIHTKVNTQQFAGFDLKFSEDAKSATLIKVSEEILKTTVYELPDWNVTKSCSSDKLLTNFPVGGLGQNKMNISKSSLSKGGKYVAIYTEKNESVTIYIFNTVTGKYVLTADNSANTANTLAPQFWTSETTMVASGASMMAGEYNMLTGSTTAIALVLDQLPGETELTVANQKNNLVYTDDMKFVGYQGTKNFYVRASDIQAGKITFENCEFICFTPDNKYLFIRKDEAVNCIMLSDISKSMLNKTTVNIYQFDKELKSVESEELIFDDANPPAGFEYLNVEAIENVELSTDEKLRILLRSINIDEKNIELKVNLIDENGKAYSGADVEKWKYIWCNVLLQSPKGTVSQINNFVVTENIDDKLPTAVALVLDHSGSMGAARINSLQYGALKLIKNKNAKDAYLLIKYDDKIKIDVPFSTNTAAFSTSLAGTGITGFGGGTALIDATYLAERKLAKLENYTHKTIILFTDGYENASVYEKSDVIKSAIENNIEINIVGFGEEVNEEYLKSIAYSTGGGFYHIYETENLKNIFTDIDYKRRNFYSIKFDTEIKGKHIALVQLCQDEEQHDSLVVAFNTDYETDTYDYLSPIQPIVWKDLKTTEFNKLIIPITVLLKPVISKEINKEFDNIDFPNILFETNSAKIIESEEEGIQEIVDFLNKYPKVYLEINGHTDNLGDANWNLTLSEQRAAAAKDLIVTKEIKDFRITSKGYGQTVPISTNDTEEGRTLNRRIEFKIKEK